MPASNENPDAGLQARGMCCERGGKALFAALDLEVPCGSALFLLGPNGSGKTTLLRALAGLSDPAAGTVRWRGSDTLLRGPEWRMQIAYLGHKAGHKDDLTVAENFALACLLDGAIADETMRGDALKRVGLSRRSALQVKRLSQGQKQRLSLARLCLSQRRVWLLDEPSAALDAEARGLLSAILCEHLDRGGIAVVATHDSINLGDHRSRELRLS